MQQKYEMGTRLIYFWYKNESKISLNFLFCIRVPRFSTHMPSLFVIKLCFTSIVKTICGGGQWLISGSQVPGYQVVMSRVSGSQVSGFLVSCPRVQVSGSQVLVPRISRSQVLDPDFRLCLWFMHVGFKTRHAG